MGLEEFLLPVIAERLFADRLSWEQLERLEYIFLLFLICLKTTEGQKGAFGTTVPEAMKVPKEISPTFITTFLLEASVDYHKVIEVQKLRGDSGNSINNWKQAKIWIHGSQRWGDSGKHCGLDCQLELMEGVSNNMHKQMGQPSQKLKTSLK